MAASDARAARAVCVENATIGELRQALTAGEATAAGLVDAYLERIAAYDRAGPRLDAVRELNPDAPAIATQSDARERTTRRPLEGIPILIKDNIATADAQHTTAGSLALEGARAKDDATVVKLLHEAGAAVPGKAKPSGLPNNIAIDTP